MANAAIDANSKQTIIARLNTDGLTVTRIKATSSGEMKVNMMTAGSVVPSDFSATDDSGRTSWFAVSEDDSTQLVALQCDSNGALLIKAI